MIETLRVKIPEPLNWKISLMLILWKIPLSDNENELDPYSENNLKGLIDIKKLNRKFSSNFEEIFWPKENEKVFESNFVSEFSTIFQRTWIDSLRNINVHRSRIFQKLYVAAFIAIIFSWIDMTSPNQSTVQSVKVKKFFYTYWQVCRQTFYTQAWPNLL